MLTPMRFNSRTGSVLAAAMMIAVLSACGGGDGPDSDYCKDIEAARPKVEGMRSSGPGDLSEIFEITHKLSAEAPGDIKDDWELIDGLYTDIEKTLKAGGIDSSKDFENLTKGIQPEGINQDKLRELPAMFQKFDAPKYAKALEAIKKHSKEVCKVEFAS